MKFATNQFKIEIKDMEKYYDIIALKKKSDFVYDNEYGQFIKRANTLSKEHENKLLALIIRNHMLYLLFNKGDVEVGDLEKYILDYEVEYFPNMLKMYKLELLINSLNKYKYPSQSNIIGKIYRLSRSSIYIEFNFQNDLLIEKVSTFTRLNNNKNLEYYRKKNFTLYKKVGDTIIYEPYNINDNKDIFINKNLKKDNKKNTVPFFSIKNFSSFQRSKVGILTYLLLDIEKYLSHCLTIKPVYCDYKEVNWKKTKTMHEKLISTLNQIQFNIVDTTNTANISLNLKELLLHAFNSLNINEKNIFISNNININAVNINIVHPAKYYTENELKDEYLNSTKFAVQNIYAENVIKEWTSKQADILEDNKYYSNIANKLLVEGLMKYEIIKHISLLECCYKLTIPNWQFVYKYSVYNSKRINTTFYFKLNIYKGKIDIKEISYSECQFAFKNSSNDYAILNEKGEVMKIYETKETPIPNFEFVYNRFIECENIIFIDKGELLKYIDSFEYEHLTLLSEKQINSFTTKSSLFKQNIKKLPDKRLSREKIVRNIPKDANGYKYFGNFIEYFYGKTGIRLAPLLKKSKDVKSYIAGMYKINYISYNNENGVPMIKYVVGKINQSNFNVSFATGMLFKIVENCDEETFKIYAKMLAVDFIRINQYTVLPYPFKYLREYAAIYIREKE